MKLISWFIVVSLSAIGAQGGTLPGFRAERIAAIEGFPTSIVVDSTGRIYYTTTDGAIYRLEGSRSIEVATVVTDGTGNSGLLGMALLDDHTAAVHYTTPRQTYDVVSKIDLRSGAETVLHRFACDVEVPGRTSPSEHHGGNPSVAPDGSIFVGIGDYSWNMIAGDRQWNGGKIHRIAPDGKVTQFARGLRNPFDSGWDPASAKLIVTDNGPDSGDEIHVIAEDSDCGWPHTWGTMPPVQDAVVPDFVFDTTVAPTGLAILNDRQPYLHRGFLVGAFVTRAIYYFAELDSPYVVIEDETPAVIDVAQSREGLIYFAAGGFSPGASGIYRLHVPIRGDCNGDGLVNVLDRDALSEELTDGSLQRATEVTLGSHRSSWGCDADVDGFVTAADAVELSRMLGWRRRAAGRK